MTMQTTKRPLRPQAISASTTTARNSSALQNSDIHVFCTSDVYIKFGGSTVEASTTVLTGYDKLVPANTGVDLNTGGATHIAVILGSSTATVHIHEWTHKAI